MTTLYVDVSHHDWSRHGGQLDWARIKAATSPVMVARATYGDPSGYSPATRYFGSMVSAAKSQGFLCGGYHNLIRGDQASINRQVDWLRRELDAAGASWAMLDVERYDELLTRSLHPRLDDAQRFCDRWRAVDHRVLTVYLPRWIWDGHMGRPDLRPLGCPLIASDYAGNPDGSPVGVYSARGGDSGRGWTAYGGVSPTIWQYGSNVDCPGASGQTDCNAYRGTLAQLRALLTGHEEDDMYDKDDAAVAWATTQRTAALMAGTDAQYRIPGEDADRVEKNVTAAALAGLIGKVDGLTGKVATLTAAVDQLAVVVAQMPATPTTGPVSREDLEAALRSVLARCTFSLTS